ncbi:death domain-containing protein 1 [Denticeps clupeoides]|uniref:death domain-containing protein 1 n=1 Tax=Denticeps clupeoides TaxID=299321 RepID=UPI0010A46F02|nr:death domain-containing protein 1 [Denticeps clupeoides]
MAAEGDGTLAEETNHFFARFKVAGPSVATAPNIRLQQSRLHTVGARGTPTCLHGHFYCTSVTNAVRDSEPRMDPRNDLLTEDHLLQLLEVSTRSLRDQLDQTIIVRSRTGLLQQGQTPGMRIGGTSDAQLRVLGVLKDLGRLYVHRVSAWGGAVRRTAERLEVQNYTGAHMQLATDPCEDCGQSLGLFSETVQIIVEAVGGAENCLKGMSHKLDVAIAALGGEKFSSGTPDDPPRDVKPGLISAHIASEMRSKDPAGTPVHVEGESSHDATDAQNALLPNVEDKQVTASADTLGPAQTHTPVMQRVETVGPGTTGHDSVPCTSTDRQEGGDVETDVRFKAQLVHPSTQSPTVCYITAPAEVEQVVACDLVDELSPLMVSDREELLSSVLKISVPGDVRCPFPLTISVFFTACYRGNYRDVKVKVVDSLSRVSYISPVSTEGSFAEVRVYALGVFAVVSCPRRETYTVPKRGLSHKLDMDSRICVDYLPGTFTTPVVVQAMVQPLDGSLLSRVTAKLGPVQSTSPLVYLTHPCNHPFRRPMTFTLPCPPSPDQRRAGEEASEWRRIRIINVTNAALLWLKCLFFRAVSSSVKSASEHLAVLVWRKEQWEVLNRVSVRNLQNGLVSFELLENFERLIAVRLRSSSSPSGLAGLVQELENTVQDVMATLIFQHERDDPRSVMVALLPSRDLSWEMNRLQALERWSPPEACGEIFMCEGELLLLSFSGNLTATGRLGGTADRITFHSQRSSRVYLRLTVKDPFGNYSSPHYKGTAIFHRIRRAQLVRVGDAAVVSAQRPPEGSVCKLCLTLPKEVRVTCRPESAKVTSKNGSDPLPSDEALCWLSEELCAEEAARLLSALQVKRSSVQLGRLRAPVSLPRQAYHILGLWRRGLPSHTPKVPLLAHGLTLAGRPDLAKELLVREGRGEAELSQIS